MPKLIISCCALPDDAAALKYACATAKTIHLANDHCLSSLEVLEMMFATPFLRHCLNMQHHFPCRLFSHSDKGGPLSLLHELDLCVVGVSSLAFGGTHHTSLAVGSMEATTHMVQLTNSDDGLLEPPQVQSAPSFSDAVFTAAGCGVHDAVACQLNHVWRNSKPLATMFEPPT